jgi:hypothetical protein
MTPDYTGCDPAIAAAAVNLMLALDARIPAPYLSPIRPDGAQLNWCWGDGDRLDVEVEVDQIILARYNRKCHIHIETVTPVDAPAAILRLYSAPVPAP